MDNRKKSYQHYNPPLSWVTWYQIGGRVSSNTPTSLRYLPNDFLVTRMHDKVNNVSLLSVFIFLNNVKSKH